MTITHNEQTLPDTYSELLQVALDDLAKCENSPQYEIGMYSWHIAHRSEGVCAVCLAGSVMAQTLKVPDNITTSYVDANFSQDTQQKLEQISDFALNSHPQAYRCNADEKILNGVQQRAKEQFPYVPYSESPEEWRAYMDALIKELKAVDM